LSAYWRIPDSKTCPPTGGFKISEPVRLLAELVRLLAEFVGNLTDFSPEGA